MVTLALEFAQIEALSLCLTSCLRCGLLEGNQVYTVTQAIQLAVCHPGLDAAPVEAAPCSAFFKGAHYKFLCCF